MTCLPTLILPQYDYDLNQCSCLALRLKIDMKTTSPEFLGYGPGLHACPVCFFAADEIKAHVLTMMSESRWKMTVLDH